ncbi:unnamed protein product [Discosporangium mesarthrocarpum]
MDSRNQRWVIFASVCLLTSSGSVLSVASGGAQKRRPTSPPVLLQRPRSATPRLSAVGKVAHFRGGHGPAQGTADQHVNGVVVGLQHTTLPPAIDGVQQGLSEVVDGGQIQDQEKPPHSDNPEGDMSVSSGIINLVADLCPHGMLPVAYGMASGGGTGLAVAPLLLLGFGCVSAYTMVSVGRACQQTRQWSFRGLWGELIGRGSAWVVEIAMAVMTFGCCIFYSAFAGDLFSALTLSATSMPAFLKRRSVDLVGLSLFPLLPLCLMENLSALQYTSFIGLVSILYTLVFVVLRSLDGTYSPGGVFYQAIDAKFRSPVASPWSSVGLWKVGPGLVTLMNMACVAYMAHYNSVKYYEELKDRTVKKYAVTIGTGMTICLGVFCTMMIFGFRTFGPAAQALILNNYHKTADPLASLARLATGFSILCGYPLMFAALKSSFFNAAAEITTKMGEGGRKLAPMFLRDKKLQTGRFSESSFPMFPFVTLHLDVDIPHSALD